MSGREKILQSVRANRPPSEELPAEWNLPGQAIDPMDQFTFHLEAIGGVARFFESKSLAIAALSELSPDLLIRDLVREMVLEDSDLEPDITVVEARAAVAENAAVYITDQEAIERNYLFLGQKLIALVSRQTLLSDMHEAYEKIDLASTGFGIFIAGPSATADIAQILVRGAHGPSEMEVWVYVND